MAQKILIIDDEPDFIEMVKIRLEVHGYEIFIANDGQEGVDLAKKEIPNLIFMDIMMPNMNGGEAVKLLKADANTNSIPIIFLTAALSREEGSTSQRINVENTSYPAIAKPFKLDEFLKTIKEVLGEQL